MGEYRTPAEEIELARQLLMERIRNSVTLVDFVRYQLALSTFRADQGFGFSAFRTAETYVDAALGDYIVLHAEQDAQAIEEMTLLLAALPDATDQVKAAFRRVRDSGRNYTAVALLQFPSHTVFYHPSQNCTRHTLDDLYKTHRQEPAYIPYMSRFEALSRLKPDPRSGIIEYQYLENGEMVKQDPLAMILAAVQNGFSNDTAVISIAEFQH